MRHPEEFTFKYLVDLILDGRLKIEITSGNNAGEGNFETQETAR